MGDGPSLYRHKLSNEAKHEICRLVAEYTPPAIIRSYLKEYFGVEISLTNINHYKKSYKWQGIITTMRNYFLANIETIPMSHKAVRIARLEQLFSHAIANSEIKTAVSILRQAQVEMEGIKVSLGTREFSPTVDMSEAEMGRILEEAQEQGIKLIIPGNDRLIVGNN